MCCGAPFVTRGLGRWGSDRKAGDRTRHGSTAATAVCAVRGAVPGALYRHLVRYVYSGWGTPGLYCGAQGSGYSTGVLQHWGTALRVCACMVLGGQCWKHSPGWWGAVLVGCSAGSTALVGYSAWGTEPVAQWWWAQCWAYSAVCTVLAGTLPGGTVRVGHRATGAVLAGTALGVQCCGHSAGGPSAGGAKYWGGKKRSHVETAHRTRDGCSHHGPA